MKSQNKGQMKIQQMAFMIVAVFFFFILVGLFFVSYHYKTLKGSYAELQGQQAVSSLQVIADMPEMNCDGRTSNCLDKDKLLVMSGSPERYADLWPVASVEVYQVYPSFNEKIRCPSANCNYYPVFNSSQTNIKTYSTFVSICEDVSRNYEKCEIGKLVVGVKDE